MTAGTQTVRVEELYEKCDEAAVRRFLQEHPEVVDGLLDAYPLVGRSFGPNRLIQLRIARDLEGPGSEDLVADIFTPLSVREALHRLDDLYDDLYDALRLALPDRIQDLLLFQVVPQ